MFDDINDMTLLTQVFYRKREKLLKTRSMRDYAERFTALQSAFNERRVKLLSAKA